MSDVDITYEDVIKACKQLKKNKTPISALTVREILGSGSFTTITKHINNWKNKVVIKFNVCSKCNGTGKTKARDFDCVDSKDIRKMKSIMKRHNLKKYQLAEILGISQSAVVGWFKLGTNVRGNIKPVYFEILELKGYK